MMGIFPAGIKIKITTLKTTRRKSLLLAWAPDGRTSPWFTHRMMSKHGSEEQLLTVASQSERRPSGHTVGLAVSYVSHGIIGDSEKPQVHLLASWKVSI